MRTLLSSLRALCEKPSPSPSRRVRLTVENCEPRVLLTLGVFQPPPLEGIFVPPDPPGHFASLEAFDASGDDSLGTVFKNGALRVSYNIVLDSTASLAPAQVGNPLPPPPPPPPPPSQLDHVTVEAWKGLTKFADLGTFTTKTVTGGLINLANTPSLTGGTYIIKATAFFKNGSTATTMAFNPLHVKTGSVLNGTFSGETIIVQAQDGNGVVIHGNGGTDSLDLLVDRDLVASLNGKPLSAYSPTAGGQAIYQGLAVDYVRLTDGREFYFTGIENLKVLDDPVLAPDTAGFIGVPGGPQVLKVPVTIPLTIKPNDPAYPTQWNLHVTDVPDAWRFTQGSSRVLLVSLDTGVFQRQGNINRTNGIPSERLIVDAGDDEEADNQLLGHGHQSISIMIGAPNDGKFHTGINWFSNVFVADIKRDSNLQDSIEAALEFARARGLKVVFQGGFQGEFWLNSGGPPADLEALFRNNADISVYAIAAGNGSVDLDVTSPTHPSVMAGLSGGVARLAASHGNVMAVGALQHTSLSTDILNTHQVFLASYSNFGSSLTMVAPTDSPATTLVFHLDGSTNLFGGTSCANPNLASLASLVWSVNASLSGAQVRQILEQTALDLGAAGRDNTFGAGLVDAGEAVRRAVALARDPALANLAFTPSAFVAAVGTSVNLPLSVDNDFPLVKADLPAKLDVVPTPLTPVVAPADISARVVKLKGQSVVKVFDAATGALRRTLKPFGKFSGKVQLALIDVNGDGTKDLVVTARIKGKLRKMVYNALDLAPLAGVPA